MKRIANLVLALGLLSFGVASCDIFDPYDPGNPGGGNGGGGGDTIIVQPEEKVEGTGTLRLIMTDEGYAFYGIEGDNGTKYEPVNFYTDQFGPDERVRFKGVVVDDWQSMNNYGTLIELHEIESAR